MIIVEAIRLTKKAEGEIAIKASAVQISACHQTNYVLSRNIL